MARALTAASAVAAMTHAHHRRWKLDEEHQCAHPVPAAAERSRSKLLPENGGR
jgi:hypothetical protein